MKWFGMLAVLLMVQPAFADVHGRVSLERILTGPAVGTQNVSAVQLEAEFLTLGPVDIGISVRKEGPGSVDGWGFGIHASRDWREEKTVKLVTQAGVRFFAPGPEYSRFQYAQTDGVVTWRQWDRISSNFRMPFTNRAAATGSWAPNVGMFAEYAVGPVRVRAGIRATIHRYGQEVMYRPPGGDLQLIRNDRGFKLIFAPAIAIGF